jgi:2,3-dihydroxybiphenyl 1,2-dioxygenase
MASVKQLGYLALNVSDLEAWEKFAPDVLGLQVLPRDPDGSLFLRMDENHHRFVLTQNGADDIGAIGWEVNNQQELAELANQLRASGIEVTAGSPEEARARRVGELIKFNDPSGIASEAYFGPLVDHLNPFHSPRPIGGFVTGTMGLGHIVLRVDDAARSLAFYRDILGMRVSDFIDLKMRRGRPTDSITLSFMHCNPRHHTVAFGQFPGNKRLLHFMLQLNSIDDVGAGYYLAQDRGVPISGSLGRHTNDHMVSFYMRSPSGFEIEYGFGARTVDDATWKVQRHESGSMWGHRGPTPPPTAKPANQ